MKQLLYSYIEPEGSDIKELPIGKLTHVMKPFKKIRAIKYNCKGCDTKVIEVYACTEDETE